MKKIGFVIPWFGMDIPGGAESLVRDLALHLTEKNIDLEILTTCVKAFNTDWNFNYHKEGVTIENGIQVRRFKVKKRAAAKFDMVNYKLMNNQLPLSTEEEQIFVEEMINSTDLYHFIEENKEEYSVFVFIPYMFGTTYYGMQICPEKTVVIPCFHDESYLYLDIFKKPFSNVKGMIFLSSPEYEIAKKVYNLENVSTKVLGTGVYTDLKYSIERFQKKYNILDPFILYAGRKDKGKNVHILLKYFSEYKQRNKTSLKLVLIGGGDIEIPSSIKEDVHDLGFVSTQDKYDAYSASTLLCQPSSNESFSLVIMESWLCNRPILVNSECAVTKNFVQESNGGLYFANYFEFEGAVKYIETHKQEADIMGKQGRNYVMNNFAWDVIVDKYIKFFLELE
ncbi:glycosyltransferase family 4 protein [Velocimicrobium porci]|uniref:Glycosyltransferase family 4 protein n=1 Tax=Velocimicrobium porci TaxID=2606634 RepID=A0A6L5Y0I9_9FIRM|nr:glycosyltransferase family 4 protein [Velocimicrobium porci]MSS64502.1 glycosyltransferase family 4 protein [Velocimicrobium porci]